MNIKLTEKNLALLQFIHSTNCMLISKYKFQIPNYAVLQNKNIEMEKLLMQIGSEFNKDFKLNIELKKGLSDEKLKMIGEGIIQGMEEAIEDENKDKSGNK